MSIDFNSKERDMDSPVSPMNESPESQKGVDAAQESGNESFAVVALRLGERFVARFLRRVNALL